MGNEAGEEEHIQVDRELDDGDADNSNRENEHSQEDTEMEQIMIEETPEESAMEEALEGVDLTTIAEEWKLNGIKAILEH